MKHVSFLLFSILLIVNFSCNTKQKDDANVSENKTAMDNPFIERSTLDFQAPDFTKIKNEHFHPALEEGLRLKLEEIERIANNPEAPTFENTLQELEKSGELLSRVSSVFYLLAGAHTNDTIKKIQQEMAPKFAALKDAMFLNEKLFQRVKTIYDTEDKQDLDFEDRRLIEYYYDEFTRSGAELSTKDKEKLKKLNGEIATLTTQFSSLVMEASKKGAFTTDDPKDLDGLSEGAIATAHNDAKEEGLDGMWVLPLQNTTQQPPLSQLKNSDIRKELFLLSWNRAEQNDENDTRELILKLVELRAKKAELLGFESYAHWNLQNTMAKTPEAVTDFFSKLVPAATKKVNQEMKELLVLINKEKKDVSTVVPSDWNYYSEILRKEKYDLNEAEIKPYFEINNVLENGVFYAAEQLYGITFKERKDLPVYHPDVRVFDVFNEDGSILGLFYSDNFKRNSKRGGAWMSNIVSQSHLLGTKPVIYNVCNFTKAADGQPSLLTWDNVTTLFHEFGHALHGLFANQKYVSLSGTSVARDFVEFPSQFNEHWALDDQVFNNYAVHYETKEPMPQELVNKIKTSSTFNQGYRLTELLAAAVLDMQWHTLPPNSNVKSVNTFENESLNKTHLHFESVPPRYRSTYFTHVFGGGYAAGYYAYLWTEMLDNDAFAWFQQNGGLTRENGERYRNMILSIGNTLDLNQAFRDLVGHEPDIQPMLRNRGMAN